MPFRKTDQMRIGCILRVGLRRSRAVHIVCKESISQPRVQFLERLVRRGPGRLIGNTQADTEKSELSNGAGIEFAHRINPSFGSKMIGMGGPAGGKTKLTSKSQLTASLPTYV